MLHFVCCGIWCFWWQLVRLKSALQVVKWLNIILISVYSTNRLGVLDCQKQGGHACIRALHLGNGITGACFQAPHAAPGQRLMETFYTHILLLMGGDATQLFSLILLLHALHTLGCNCTCQNNPRLSCGLLWWCGRLFLSSLHTTILHMCAGVFSFHLTHHHSSNILSSCGWWCNSSSLSSSYTPPRQRQMETS